MPVLMQLIGLNARKAVVASTNCMHGLVIPGTWDAVSAVASLARLRIRHLHGAKVTAMFCERDC
jgi:hypothetical protein